MKLIKITILLLSISCTSEKIKEETKLYTNGKIREKYTTKNDIIHGNYQQFYPTGELMSKKTFVNGKEEGKSTSFYETGELKEVQYFKEGKIHGGDTVYYKNGIKRYTSFFSNNLKDGKFQRWSETDILEFESIYKLDSLIEVINYTKPE